MNWLNLLLWGKKPETVPFQAMDVGIDKINFIRDSLRMKPPVKLHCTLWPSFPHFSDFKNDDRLAGIRLNSAMMAGAELDSELATIKSHKVPLWFDIKGRQLRVREAIESADHLELIVNHPITVDLPVMVLFKAGNDGALLKEIHKGGTHLIFEKGPRYRVKPGESLHIRHKSLIVHEPVFLDYEVDKIQKVIKAGFTNFYLSYVEQQTEIDQLRELIGPDAQLILKIENQKGLDFALNKWVKTPNTHLMAARGDLFVELERPHEILSAVKGIIKKDREAFVGSRILLSVIHSPVPECDDFSDLAWLYDIGYRNFLLCDELCLKGDLLGRAVNVFDAFKESYP